MSASPTPPESSSSAVQQDTSPSAARSAPASSTATGADDTDAASPPATDEDKAADDGVETAEEGATGNEGENPAKPDPWQAVFSPEANAWYFWNSETQETTWTNPRAPPEPAEAESAATAAPHCAEQTQPALPGIDPELAWLDPSAAVRGGKGGIGLTQTARFNARTGRFQGDPAMNPDRISDFQRGHRQQEAYFDVEGWETSLAGRGLKRAGEPSDETAKKRPTTKQVDQFRRAKEEKKRKKLASWLGS